MASNKPQLSLGRWKNVFQFAKLTGQETFHLRNQCKIFRDALSLPAEYRFWRLKTIDQEFADRRWVIKRINLYDYANRKLTGNLMASSAQGPHHQGKYGNYVDAKCYVGEEAHNAGKWGGYWSADYYKNDWMGIDLGVGCTSSACRLVIEQETTSQSSHYLIQSSSDGTTWNTEHECFFSDAWRTGDSRKHGVAVSEEHSW